MLRSEDVFPDRNLGAAEPWGRKTEDRIRALENELVLARQLAKETSIQTGSLAGTVNALFPAQTDTYTLYAGDDDAAVSQTGTWVEVASTPELRAPDGYPYVNFTISGEATVSRPGQTDMTNPPWFKIVAHFGDGASTTARMNGYWGQTRMWPWGNGSFTISRTASTQFEHNSAIRFGLELWNPSGTLVTSGQPYGAYMTLAYRWGREYQPVYVQ